jgi:hemolysin activation/secretion protein
MQVQVISRLLLALAVALAGSEAHAQADTGSIERTIPKVEVTPEQRQAKVAMPSVPAERGARVSGTFVLSAVNIDGATVFSSEELAKSFEPYLASRIGQAELDKIAADITERYRRAGYLLSYAVVPEQSVSSGIVRIRVIEGFIGKVRIAGSSQSAAAVRQLAERLGAERPLRKTTLERTLGLVRDIPGIVLTDTRIGRNPRNPESHELTLTLRADRIRALAYTDNRGTIGGARLRGYSSFNLASLAVPGDQLQVDLFSIPSDDFRFFYGQVKASVPLGSDGLRATVSASRGDQFQRLSGPDQHGKSRQLAAELAYPFRESRALSLAGHVSLSDWKSEEKRAGAVIQSDRFQVARAWLEFSHLSKTRIDGRIGISRGLDLDSATEAGDPRASRPHAGADFTKLNANLRVVTPLAERLTLRTEMAAQYALQPLLGPEEFALGGSRIGRAFDFNEVTGDHGIGGVLEIAYRLRDTKRGPKSVEVFGFADGGGVFRRKSSPALPEEQWLASAGTGMRFSALGFLWSGEIGIPVARSHADRDVRAFFSVARAF